MENALLERNYDVNLAAMYHSQPLAGLWHSLRFEYRQGHVPKITTGNYSY